MKNNNIPTFLLCSTLDLARQVLEKIERESDLRWAGREKEKPTEFIPDSYYPEMVISTTDDCLVYADIECFTEQGITNFTKAEDFLGIDTVAYTCSPKLIKSTKPMTNKTWDNLESGDVLIDNNDREVSVLAIVGRIIFISEPDNFDESNCYYTSKELVEIGYKIKGASEEKPGLDRAIELLELTINPHNTYYQDRGTVEEAIEMLKKLK